MKGKCPAIRIGVFPFLICAKKCNSVAQLKYNEEKFSKMQVCGIECEFSVMRIGRGSIPEGNVYLDCHLFFQIWHTPICCVAI